MATLVLPRTSKAQGVAFVLGAGVLWSTIPLGVRFMESATAPQIVFWRATVQVPVLAAILLIRYRGRVVLPVRSIGWNGVWGAIALAISYVSGMAALTLTTVGNAVFVLSTAPLMTALLARLLLKERLKRTTWMAMALASIGVAVMTAAAMGSGQLAGNVAAAVSALGYAVFTVSLRRGRSGDMLPTIALSGLFAAILAALIADGLAVSSQEWAIAAYLGAFGIGLGLVLYTAGSKTLSAAELPLVAMIESVLAPIWVWLFLGEAIDAATFLGGAIVMIAVLIQALLGFRRERLPIGIGA